MEGMRSDAADIRPGRLRMDYLSGGKYRAGVGLFPSDGKWHFVLRSVVDYQKFLYPIDDRNPCDVGYRMDLS